MLQTQGDQSAFTNFSVFDRNYLVELFGTKVFPNGELGITMIEGFLEHQKIFLEEFSRIKGENLFGFPVVTISLLYQDGKFVDEDFAMWACEHNRKWNDSNLFISGELGILSSCPLDGDTEILYWGDRLKRFFLSSIEDVYNNYSRDGKIPLIKTFSNGQIINCKINKFDIAPEYEITLANNAKIRTTGDHLNKVYGRDYVRTKELTTNDFLPYGLNKYIGSDSLSYEEGKIVGAFLGDGSFIENGIVLSLNSNTDRDFMDWLHDYIPKYFGGKCIEDEKTSTISGKKSCINFRIISKYLKGLIEQCVLGKNALTKEINLIVLNYSEQFRQGLIDGWQTTDGGNNNRIYSSSKKLIDTMVVVFTSLGIVTRIDEDNRENRLGKNTCYTLRFYTPNKKKIKDLYIVEEDMLWIKIKSITRCCSKKRTSYCLEVLDDVEPVFTLGNGIITHNCRVTNDTKQMPAFINSIGGTALSIGSVKVNTINLKRIAIESGRNQDKFMEILEKRMTLVMKVLKIIRKIITRNIEKGLLTNYVDGCIDMEKQFCTIGM